MDIYFILCDIIHTLLTLLLKLFHLWPLGVLSVSMLFAFSIRVLNLLIVDILNTLTNNSTIVTVSE